MFTAALFTIARTWKQPRCPSTDGWIKKLWYLLGINTKETRTERDTCIPVFITALFTIARTWKQPRCPLTDEWIKKLQDIYTKECYSVIKRCKFVSVEPRWTKLDPVIHSEVSQKEKNKYCILTHIYGI